MACVLLNIIEFGANALYVIELYETLHCVPFGRPVSINSVYGIVVDEVVLEVVVGVELVELPVVAYAKEAFAAYMTATVAIASIAKAAIK